MEKADTKRAAPSTRPMSDVSGWVGFVGVIGLGAWVVLCRNWPTVVDMLALDAPHEVMDGPYAAVAALLAAALPMLAWSIFIDKVHRHPSIGLDWAHPRSARAAWDTAWVKILGLWGTWALIGFIYCLGRWYWAGSYVFALKLIAAAIGPMMVLSVPYVWWLDRVLRDPRDGAWHFGAMVLGREGADMAAVLKHLRTWAVKGFFTAFMLSIISGGFGAVVTFDMDLAGADPGRWIGWMIDVLFMIDVLIGTVGYLLTLRPLGAHIRSANPYLEGWVAALICYPPFVLIAPGGIIDYHTGGTDWGYWMADHPALMWVWGAWMVLLTAIYASATVAFGIRFSNLTYRGVITHGPYALCRHPAYLSKNLFWWSSALPFLTTTHLLSDMVRNTVMLCIVNAVYFWRAKTEERHLLAEDPKYREYWHWAEAHAPLTRATGAVLRWVCGRAPGK